MITFNKTVAYGSKLSSGFDIESTEFFILKPMERRLVSTGLVMLSCDPNVELQIRPRSGNAYKKGLTVINTPGTVDADFTGREIKILLINLGSENIEVNPGDRVAQGVICPVLRLECSKYAPARIGGCGSTGV